MSDQDDIKAYLHNIARDMQAIRGMVTEVVNYMKEAESEVSEKMRRFIMYFHDVHDVMWTYHENGQEPPEHVRREVERCSDRYKHLIEDSYADEGTFERVRQEMSQREGNRYDWTKLLMRRKADEARDS